LNRTTRIPQPATPQTARIQLPTTQPHPPPPTPQDRPHQRLHHQRRPPVLWLTPRQRQAQAPGGDAAVCGCAGGRRAAGVRDLWQHLDGAQLQAFRGWVVEWG